jgi:origin recognition complex subunit 1
MMSKHRQFAARKIANFSGDIRKVFHMCKVAAEAVLEEYVSGKRQLPEGSRPIVRIADVQRGSRDIFTSMVLKAVSCSTDYEALLLISLGALKRGNDDSSFDIKDLLTKITSIANASGEQRYMNARLSFADLLGMVNRLGDVSTATYVVRSFLFSMTLTSIGLARLLAFPLGWSHKVEFQQQFTLAFDNNSSP